MALIRSVASLQMTSWGSPPVACLALPVLGATPRLGGGCWRGPLRTSLVLWLSVRGLSFTSSFGEDPKKLRTPYTIAQGVALMQWSAWKVNSPTLATTILHRSPTGRPSGHDFRLWDSTGRTQDVVAPDYDAGLCMRCGGTALENPGTSRSLSGQILP